MNPSLQQKKVLVPRGKDNADTFARMVKSFGGIPIKVPLLDFRPTVNKDEAESYLSQLHTYDWIIFTSEITVTTFFSFVNKKINLPKIAAIGEKTKEVLNQMGYEVEFIPKKYVAENFAEEFLPHCKMGDKILLPKGNLAREYISNYLGKHGITVESVIIYETFFPEESKKRLKELLDNRMLDILPFTSPSTINHFMSVVRENDLYQAISHCIIAVIGPVSKKKCEEQGLKVDVMPEKYTSYEMLKAVATYISQCSPTLE